jgi:dTDP-4-dehydrorhamnose reductase
LYGKGGPSFVHRIVEKTKISDEPLTVICDNYGTPTSASVVSDYIRLFITRQSLNGTFHVTCSGSCSWYDFAKRIIEKTNINREITPQCKRNSPKSIATRPFDSTLDKKALRLHNITEPQNWQDALDEFLSDYPNI